MTDEADVGIAALQSGLTDRYAIGREIGRGGMAVVYLATDVRHDRPVALKVLRPELRSVVGAERFLREIRLTARLQHPNILPLHDSGEGAGLLFYVTPFIEGESLRKVLARTGRLAIGDAVRLALETSDALDYAHAHGVVHRDIKPDNILLAHGHAVVADFGIARALTAAGTGALTDTGVALGTAAYMSPEQTVGQRELDGRSDIYSLGCVLFEVLTGKPPFTDAKGQLNVARRFSELAPHVSEERTDVPQALDAIVARMLGRSPEERYGSARELVAALQECVALMHSDPRGVLRVSASPSSSSTIAPVEPAIPAVRPTFRLTRRRFTYGIASVVVAVSTVMALSRKSISDLWNRTTLDPNRDVVAVIPFDVVGIGATIGEGMPFMLESRLGSDVGPRVADPDRVVELWSQRGSKRSSSPSQDIRVAQQVGAARLVRGRIIGSGGSIEIDAELLAVPSGERRGSHTVHGSADSIAALCDSIALSLLGAEAGEGASRLNALRAIPTDAVFAYLRGRIAYARGRYDDAVVQFRQSLDIDSTLALAGLYLSVASNWVGVGNELGERGLRLAWASRGQLNEADRTYLEGMAGSHYPDVPPIREQVDLWARAVRAAPADPDPYFEWGERLFIYGEYIAEPNAREASRTQLLKSVQYWPKFVAPLERLAELALMDGDTVQGRKLIARLDSIDALSERTGFLKWRLAIATRDSAALKAIRASIPRMSERSIDRIWLTAQLSGVGLDDARLAVESLFMRSGPADALANVARYFLDMNRGWPSEAVGYLEKTIGYRDEIGVLIQAQMVHDAMFGSGDSSAAERAVSELTKIAQPSTTRLAPVPLDRAAPYIALCVINQWRVWRGHVRPGDAKLVPRLRALADTLKPLRLGGQSIPFIGSEPTCPEILDALVAVAEKRPDATAVVDRLDRHMIRGPMDVDASFGNLIAARLWEQQGNPGAALKALRRRPYAPLGLFYLATSLREEGRLAAAAGDTSGAIRAYEHYLRLRPSPEPSLRAEAADVRSKLERLRSRVAAEASRRRLHAARERKTRDTVHGGESGAR